MRLKQNSFKVALATALASVAMIGSASAMTTTSGAYTQSTGSLSCSGHVQDDGDGGILKVSVSGKETRPSDKHFRTWKVRTVVYAQEKAYNGVWYDVAHSSTKLGVLGDAYSNDEGTLNTSPFLWGGSSRPTIAVPVSGFDDLFRARVVTKVYDDEGALIKTLQTVQGQCRL